LYPKLVELNKKFYIATINRPKQNGQKNESKHCNSNSCWF